LETGALKLTTAFIKSCNTSIEKFGTYKSKQADTPTIECFLTDSNLSLLTCMNSYVYIAFSEYVKAIYPLKHEQEKLSKVIIPSIITILQKQLSSLNEIPPIPPRKKNQPIEPVENPNTTFTKVDVEMMLHCIQCICTTCKELFKDYYKETLKILVNLGQYYLIALGSHIIFTIEHMLVAVKNVRICCVFLL